MISPRTTAWVPWYRPQSRAAKVAAMMKATSTARRRLRLTAVPKARSVESSKRPASRASWPCACTTGMAPSTSAAMALLSATRSWLARERRRTLRPAQIAGSTTPTRMPSTCAITTGLVTISMPSAPRPITVLRRPMDRLEPTRVCTSVVSVVRRESTSPTWVDSKNWGLCRSTWR